MKTIPSALILEKNKLNSTYPWLLFLDISLTGGDYFYIVRNTEDVTLNGQLYTAFPFEIDVDKQDVSGQIPTIALRVCNINRVVQAHLEDHDGLVDEIVVLRIVNYGNLGEDYTNLTFTFTILGCAADAEWVTFTLGAPNPLSKRVPLDRYFGNHCRYKGNFKGVECKYSGADTTCEGTLTACQEKDNSANFGGFPGLVKGSLRLV